MEDYKKKYEEAIERLKQWDREHPSGYSIQERDEFIFPELAESEDERMKEAIIATIHLYYGEPLEDEAKEMIAWLEAQGEYWKPSDEQMEYLAKAILTLRNEGDCKTVSILNELRTDLKKLKE